MAFTVYGIRILVYACELFKRNYKYAMLEAQVGKDVVLMSHDCCV